MAFTTDTANKIIDCILRNQTLTPATTLYVSLHNGDPGNTGANEITSYTRQAITFSAASNKTTTNSGEITFTNMPAVTVSYVGLWSASVAGTFWWGSALAENKTTDSGDTFKIAAGDFDVSLT